jgi:hypothetical protein
MVNLIPPLEKKSLAFAYYTKLFALLFFMSALVVGIGSLLLLPSFFLANDQNDSALKYLSALEGTQAVRQKSETGKTVAAFSERLSILKTFERKPLSAQILATLEKNLPKDLSAMSIKISYTDEKTGIITMNGIGKTRTSLLSYAESLREESIFTGVSVPVTQLANDADLKYTLEFGFKIP